MSKNIKREELLEVMFDFQKNLEAADNMFIGKVTEGEGLAGDINELEIYKYGYIHLKTAISILNSNMTLLLEDNFKDFKHIAPEVWLVDPELDITDGSDTNKENISDAVKKHIKDLKEKFEDEEFSECNCEPNCNCCVGTLGEHNKKMEEESNYIKDIVEDFEETYDDTRGMDTDGDEDFEEIDEFEENECKCSGNCSCDDEDHECTCGGNCKCHEETTEEETYKPTTEELVSAIMSENEELQKWQALEMLYNPLESLTEEQMKDLRRVYDRALLYLSENYKYKTVEEFIKAKHAIIRLNMDDLTLKDLGIHIVNDPIERDDEEEDEE